MFRLFDLLEQFLVLWHSKLYSAFRASAEAHSSGLDITKWTLFSNAFAGEEYATCVRFRAVFQDPQLVVMRHEEVREGRVQREDGFESDYVGDSDCMYFWQKRM